MSCAMCHAPCARRQEARPARRRLWRCARRRRRTPQAPHAHPRPIAPPRHHPLPPPPRTIAPCRTLRATHPPKPHTSTPRSIYSYMCISYSYMCTYVPRSPTPGPQTVVEAPPAIILSCSPLSYRPLSYRSSSAEEGGRRSSRHPVLMPLAPPDSRPGAALG